MSLIICNECGEKISSKALSCPKCGAPAQSAKPIAERVADFKKSKTEKSNRLVNWIIIGVLAAGVPVISWFVYQDHTEQMEEGLKAGKATRESIK